LVTTTLFDPATGEEMDDLIIEYKNEKALSKANFELLLASVEFVLPRFKGSLAWCRAVSKGWSVSHQTKHSTPMGKGPAHLVATHMAAMGHSRLGLGMCIQQQQGLRPSEMLGIVPTDCLVNEPDGVSITARSITIRLGKDVGTKAKREQFTIMKHADNPLLFWLMLQVISRTHQHHKLFPYAYSAYRRLLRGATDKLGLQIAWTPHSPRSGFASEGIASGKSFVEIKEAGRWLSESSFRVYIDLVTSAAISTSLSTRGLAPAQAYAVAHLEQFIRPELLGALLPHGRDGATQPTSIRASEPEDIDSGGSEEHRNSKPSEGRRGGRRVVRARGRGRGRSGTTGQEAIQAPTASRASPGASSQTSLQAPTSGSGQSSRRRSTSAKGRSASASSTKRQLSAQVAAVDVVAQGVGQRPYRGRRGGHSQR
jgi:hypothetical protein